MIAFPLELPAAEQERLQALAQRRVLQAGEVLFYEGEPADRVYVLVMGRCALTWGGQERGIATVGDLLDPAASLGGIPHRSKATALAACELLYWDAVVLWESATFGAAARRFLAMAWQAAQTRRDELAAPIRYRPATAEAMPGPFRFDTVNMIFAFCESPTMPLLPDGLRVLQRPLRPTTPFLIALADFPNAYPESQPDARFAYRETTLFVPVRYKTALGFYVAAIYPSAWEPILIGREVYGFPKQLGDTLFSSQAASVVVDGENILNLSWQGAVGAAESELVGALVAWLGLRLGGAAFQVGELLRRAARLPAFRRVDVYNEKRIPAADSTPQQPRYGLHQLTRATFGVLNWQQIAKLEHAQLSPSRAAVFGGLTLRTAYRTTLDMRLSAGRVIEDYLDT